jgi:hypothetical protein
MTTITMGLGLASTALVALGYAVRVTFEHDRLAEDQQYGRAGRGTATGPALGTETGLLAVPDDLRGLVSGRPARPWVSALV